MKNESKFNVTDCLRSLGKKQDCKLFTTGHIHVNSGTSKRGVAQKKNDLGNGSWAKIDFLVNYCGFVLVFVPEF